MKFRELRDLAHGATKGARVVRAAAARYVTRTRPLERRPDDTPIALVHGARLVVVPYPGRAIPVALDVDADLIAATDAETVEHMADIALASLQWLVTLRTKIGNTPGHDCWCVCGGRTPAHQCDTQRCVELREIFRVAAARGFVEWNEDRTLLR